MEVVWKCWRAGGRGLSEVMPGRNRPMMAEEHSTSMAMELRSQADTGVIDKHFDIERGSLPRQAIVMNE